MSEIVPVPAASLPIPTLSGQAPGYLRQSVGRAVDATGNESRARQPGRRAGATSCSPLPFPNTTRVTFPSLPSRQIYTTAANSFGDNQVPRRALTALPVSFPRVRCPAIIVHSCAPVPVPRPTPYHSPPAVRRWCTRRGRTVQSILVRLLCQTAVRLATTRRREPASARGVNTVRTPSDTPFGEQLPQAAVSSVTDRFHTQRSVPAIHPAR